MLLWKFRATHFIFWSYPKILKLPKLGRSYPLKKHWSLKKASKYKTSAVQSSISLKRLAHSKVFFLSPIITPNMVITGGMANNCSTWCYLNAYMQWHCPFIKCKKKKPFRWSLNAVLRKHNLCKYIHSNRSIMRLQWSA